MSCSDMLERSLVVLEAHLRLFSSPSLLAAVVGTVTLKQEQADALRRLGVLRSPLDCC